MEFIFPIFRLVTQQRWILSWFRDMVGMIMKNWSFIEISARFAEAFEENNNNDPTTETQIAQLSFRRVVKIHD